MDTKLQIFHDINVLFLTMWVSCCLSIINRLVPSLSRCETRQRRILELWRGMKRNILGCFNRVYSSVFWSLGRRDKFSSKSQTEPETWKFPWSSCWEAFLIGKVLWTSRNTAIRSNVCQRFFSSSKMVGRANFPLSLMRTWRVSWGSFLCSNVASTQYRLVSSFVLGMRANVSIKYLLVVLKNSLISWL